MKTQLTVFSALGMGCFIAAHKLLQLHIITDDQFFQLYALGLLFWAGRQRLHNTSTLIDKTIGNVIIWLCIFNCYDERFAPDPQHPYKPYIATAIIIAHCTITALIHYRNARRKRSERTDI